MDQAETASARHHTYLLISRLFMDGVSADLLPYIAEIPELAEELSHSLSPDEAAAAHYQVFAHDIFPYESIYRDPSGLLGGIYTDEVMSFYQKAGIHFFADGDHIGHELSFLAALCNAEVNALNNYEAEQAALLAQFQFTFLREHLLCWLPTFSNALSYSDYPFYAALGQLTINLVYDHWVSICPGTAITLPIESHEGQLRHLSDLLQDQQTSLKQIAGFLIMPPNSGLYFGRETIAKLARSSHLPRGFGSRQQILSNLLHSAAQYEQMPALLQGIARICDSWCRIYLRQIATYPEFAAHIEPWLRRAESTGTALSAMHESSLAVPYSP